MVYIFFQSSSKVGSLVFGVNQLFFLHDQLLSRYMSMIKSEDLFWSCSERKESRMRFKSPEWYTYFRFELDFKSSGHLYWMMRYSSHLTESRIVT